MWVLMGGGGIRILHVGSDGGWGGGGDKDLACGF